VRADYWSTYNGNRTDTPPPAGVPARQTFGDSERFLTSPRGAALFHATSTTDLRASIYQGYRVPTLNELYRLFRVRNDVTVANPELRPERMTGGELGLEQRWGPFAGRVTGFWNDVKDLVANVTLTSRLSGGHHVPTAPEPRPGADTRRRDRARATDRPRLALPPGLPLHRRACHRCAPAAGPRGQAPGAGAHEHRHRLVPLHEPGLVQP